MCGIVAEFRFKHSPMCASGDVVQMIDAIHHRGEGTSYIKSFENCVVGYRRLAITDIESEQPGGLNWKVYLNGEIYNYKELGFDGCESEVISKGLDKYGPSFIEKLNGMFFILAVNGPDVFVFRDRYGIKPVYTYETDEKVLIASEAKAIVNHPDYKFGVNKDAKRQWMVFNNVLDDSTLFKGINKLPKGTFWNVRLGTKVKFWSWESNVDLSIDLVTAVSQVRSLIEKSVKRQIPDTVPYATCLSGGIDSNTIASFLPSEIEGYTVTYPGNNKELELALLTGRKVNEVHIDELKMFDETIYHLEDLRVGASWPNMVLFNEISKHSNNYKVVFDGAGADELFGGYPWRYDAEDYYDIVNRTKIKDLYCQKLFLNLFHTDSVENRLRFDEEHFLEGVLLVGDKLSMANTLELRVPFLDNNLVDFVLKLPKHFRYNKHVLRLAMKNRLPDEILDGKKVGFTSPNWLGVSNNQALNWANSAFNSWLNQYS